MEYREDRFLSLAGAIDVTVSSSCFYSEKGVSEWHVMVTLEETPENFVVQLQAVHEAMELWRIRQDGGEAICVFRRYFLSDAANQDIILQEQLRGKEAGIVSVVQQPPLNRTKVALWLYYQQGCRKGPYHQHWFSQQAKQAEESAVQMRSLWEAYREDLAVKNMTIRDHCLRTWLFVRDIDVNYKGVVEARKDFFREQGLTEQTHFIASTGIEGRTSGVGSCVAMDAYAVSGLRPEQICYLKALDYLNPTWEYGVTFERGVSILYGDRKQAYISGTASIDCRGAIVGPGEIVVQLDRMWANVQALLREGDYDSSDIAQMIIYMRDPGDQERIKDFFARNLPCIPRVMVWAPVCRPGWLVEMECIAIKKVQHAEYADF